MIPDLRIALVQDRPDQPFYSGSSITGSLWVGVNEPKSYKCISVQLLGRANVQWTETQGQGQVVRYTSSEDYVNVTQAWSADQFPDRCLPPGQHSFPFRFDIPPNAPSSFEGTAGSIRYELYGRMWTDSPNLEHRIAVRVPVQQVVGVSDPRLLQPVHLKVQKTVGFSLCASAPIVLTVTVPKTGYCIGETLPVHVSIENGSSRRITLTATLCQSVVYCAENHTKYMRKFLVHTESGEIAPHITREWDPTLQIPGTEILHELSSSIIQMSYFLKITAVIPRTFNLSTAVLLKLGNVREQPPL